MPRPPDPAPGQLTPLQLLDALGVGPSFFEDFWEEIRRRCPDFAPEEVALSFCCHIGHYLCHEWPKIADPEVYTVMAPLIRSAANAFAITRLREGEGTPSCPDRLPDRP